MRGKYAWIIPLVLALLVGGVGWWADRELRRTVHQELRDDLQSTLEANVTALEIWMENQKRIATSLAEEPRLKAAALKLLNQSVDTPTNRVLLGELSRELITGGRLQERVHSLGYDMVQLVSSNMLVVSDAGRRRSHQGNEVLAELQPKYSELFARGEPIIITPFKLKPPENIRRPGERPGNDQRPRRDFFGPAGTNSPTVPRGGPPPSRELRVMQVAAPIDAGDGQARGALALGINPDAEFTRILSVARGCRGGLSLGKGGCRHSSVVGIVFLSGSHLFVQQC